MVWHHFLFPRHRGTIAPLASIALSIASTFQRWTLERVLHSMVSCYKYVSVFNTQGHCAVVSRARGAWGLGRPGFFACFLHFFTN